jgi:hypothetical protein
LDCVDSLTTVGHGQERSPRLCPTGRGAARDTRVGRDVAGLRPRRLGGLLDVVPRFDRRAREALLDAARWAFADKADSIELEHLRRALDGTERSPSPDVEPPSPHRPRPRGVCYRAPMSPDLVVALERAAATRGRVTVDHLRAAVKAR